MDIRIGIRTLLILCCILSASVFAAPVVPEDNPCTGLNSLLSIINRPSILESPCTVPANQVLLEMGYTYEQLKPFGQQSNFPAAVLRFGLPNGFEVIGVLPNYIQQNFNPRAGFNPAVLGVKHELFINKVVVASMEVSVIFPSGSYYFGSKYPGGIINGILSYNITDTWSIIGFAGFSSISSPSFLGGGSYRSFNPILDLVWTKDKISIYGEISAQTKSGLYQGGGMNTDAAIIYLLRPYMTIDFEVSHRISGEYGNFNDYVGAGLAILFS